MLKTISQDVEITGTGMQNFEVHECGDLQELSREKRTETDARK